eukprot:349015-Pyramimonas_sp.AAC.1
MAGWRRLASIRAQRAAQWPSRSRYLARPVAAHIGFALCGGFNMSSSDLCRVQLLRDRRALCRAKVRRVQA